MNSSRVMWAVILGAVTGALSQAADPAPPPKTSPLDAYIQKADPNYQWTLTKTIQGNPSTTCLIHLKSQAWLTDQEVDRTVWEHWLLVVVPDRVTTDKAFLYITGGANNRPMPEKADAMTEAIAAATGSIVAELRMVPNQPLVFHGDGQPRTEDDLIGYAWDQFLKTGNENWLPRLPMVKSAVRAMDCVQELARQKGHAVNRFVVAGGSKRGWTTWLTGAADKRVEAIVPIVIDVLHLEPSIRHHAQVYGFWARAIGDYYRHQLLQRPDHPRMKELHAIVDPYSYRDRLTMPKFIVNASGDQFFCPDSSQFYYDDLHGEKLLRYVPNADHSLRGSDAIESIIAFYQMIIAGRARPEMTWSFTPDNAIRVVSRTPARQAWVWQAVNPRARDFRQMTIGNAFVSRKLDAQPDGSYLARLEPPEKGWAAFFVELAFDSGSAQTLKLSTAVRVLPDTLPHANIDPQQVPYEGNVRQPAAAAPAN